MKDWYKSKTLWFNALTCLLLIVTEIVHSGMLANQQVIAAFGLVITIGNIILRVFFTSEGIKGINVSKPLSPQT
jgi:hypothetical protein